MVVYLHRHHCNLLAVGLSLGVGCCRALSTYWLTCNFLSWFRGLGCFPFCKTPKYVLKWLSITVWIASLKQAFFFGFKIVDQKETCIFTFIDSLLVNYSSLCKTIQVIHFNFLPWYVGDPQINIPELLVFLLYAFVQSPRNLKQTLKQNILKSF